MFYMMNNVTLIGRVARDIELRKTQTGVSVATIVIAVDRDFSSNKGQREADFISVEVWNKTADYCAKNIEKGRLISVQGSIRTNRYETKEGQRRTSFVIRANRVNTSERPRGGVAPSNQSSQPYQVNNQINSSVSYQEPQISGFEELNPDDIPF